MRSVRRPIAEVLFALLMALWLAAGQPASAAGVQPVGRPALTLTLSQGERGLGEFSQMERGPSRKQREAFDTPTCPLEKRLLDDVADGRLDEFSPLGAALVASGVSDLECLHRYQQKAAALVEELRRSGKLTDRPHERVEAIFDFMHERVLVGGYDLAYTDLRRVVDQGRFNCVSATVLFNYLAEELGLECRGLEMPGHAMSRVSLPGGTLDVETTCPRWFALKEEPQRQSAAVAQTIGAAASADRSKAREVSAIQLAAMIYYNRGVDLLAEKRFREAARANAKAVRLDPQNATARGNLLATINNWAIELGNTQHFDEAIDLLRQGMAMDAKFEPFLQNFVHIHRQWTDRLCQEGQFDEAMLMLARVIDEMPNRKELRSFQSDVSTRKTKAVAAKRP